VVAAASRHFGCIAGAAESDTPVLVFVVVTGLGVLSQRAVEQGRSLPESGSLNEGKRYAGRRELKQRMGLGGLESLSDWLSAKQEFEMHTRDL
jgi:hypothetical protein